MGFTNVNSIEFTFRKYKNIKNGHLAHYDSCCGGGSHVCIQRRFLRNIILKFVLCFSFSFSSRWHRSAQKGPYALRPVSQQSPQGCPRNSANICLVEHRSFSAFEGGMSAASFLHSSFLQAVNAVMLWLVRAEKVPQASEHLCPAKLQTRCNICCACQSICPFIPTGSGVPRTVDP